MVVAFVIILILVCLGFYAIAAGLILAMAAVITLISLFAYIVCSIFYYLIGRDAGFELPWIAFFPGGKNYIAFTIPHREFNMGIFSTFNRKLVFWIWFAAETLVYLLCAGGLIYIFVEQNHIAEYFINFTPSMLTDNMAEIIIAVIFICFLILYFILRSPIHWRKNYDLLKTYGYSKAAIIIPSLNIICPLVMMVFPLFLAGRLPEYGADGYYPLEENY